MHFSLNDLSHQLLKAVDKSNLEWRQVVRKKHLGGTKILKKLSEQRKLLRPFWKTAYHLICNLGILRHEILQLYQ